MELLLARRDLAASYTIGDLYVDGAFECYTLEDPVREGPKVYGQTAIPTGKYEVKLTWSPRFKRELPLLLNVPGFEGIRIHAGNTSKDTEGCILVGQEKSEGRVMFSQAALSPLIVKIATAHDCFITIEEP